MVYTAVIEIDDDRWAKHPYSIRIKDENGRDVLYRDSLNSLEACYRISDRYNIPHLEIPKEHY